MFLEIQQLLSLDQLLIIDPSLDISAIDPNVLVVYHNTVISTSMVKEPSPIPLLLMQYCEGALTPLLNQVNRY